MIIFLILLRTTLSTRLTGQQVNCRTIPSSMLVLLTPTRDIQTLSSNCTTFYLFVLFIFSFICPLTLCFLFICPSHSDQKNHKICPRTVLFILICPSSLRLLFTCPLRQSFSLGQETNHSPVLKSHIFPSLFDI